MEEAVKAVMIEINRLKLEPGEFLILKALPDWSPRQIGMFQQHLDYALGDRFPELPSLKILVIPYTEISVVQPSGK